MHGYEYHACLAVNDDYATYFTKWTKYFVRSNINLCDILHKVDKIPC